MLQKKILVSTILTSAEKYSESLAKVIGFLQTLQNKFQEFGLSV